jgi:sugar phosphate isomerase/epimerase
MALIGAQMFTLREYCKTPSDIAASCARVKKMGYDGIQASAAGFNDIAADELKKILDGEGLQCAATHRGLDAMRDDPQKQIDWHQTVGCKYTAIGGTRFGEEGVAGDWEKFAAEYSTVTKTLDDAGLHAGYHNHSHELVTLARGLTPLDILIGKCQPHVWFEIDVYWIAHGLGDPAAWVDKVASSGAGRIPCVHYKDGTVNAKREHKMMPVGEGNLNWPRINEACARAGVEWYLVERDSGEHDPFDALQISLDNLRAMGL